MTRTFILAGVAALALTAGAADARMHHHKSMTGHKTAGSVATRDLNNKQLASMESAGAGMNMSSGTAMAPGAAPTGGMAATPPTPTDAATPTAPAAPAAPAGSMDPQQPK